MPNSTREIKRRIRSVSNIGQITKAMELVSAAKMRKAQVAASASRPYSQLSSELVASLLGKVTPDAHPLIRQIVITEDGYEQKPGPQRTLAILISSDKGLAGPLNANAIAAALRMSEAEGASTTDFVSIGKKGSEALKRAGQNIVAVFPWKDRDIKSTDAKPVTDLAISEFLAMKYTKVLVVYTDFISTLVQKPAVLQILPLAKDPPNPLIMEDFLFEPSPDEVLEQAIRRYIRFAVYQCMQEAAASEHSARMVAMKNANQSASDLIDELTLSANQARQAGITRELSEISTAKIAMEG